MVCVHCGKETELVADSWKLVNAAKNEYDVLGHCAECGTSAQWTEYDAPTK
ncbi:hypothetical protein [Alicyclobacillus sp. ALC3]|uniref:hypothetical protein n=1 Tax=Alicyclobacillus sp. ALC3 TaxID=2796143 RepID=UPI0023782020|nr:hypothetical protein [Alicyclobacillus sp. ALC3]WDL96936.1 hypothetical protein JC200_22100 [Alicyclobacillus sp. ALC3]